MKQTVNFKIDANFVVDFVRQRYWYEGQSYEWALETLLACFVIPEEKREAYKNSFHQILTGAKTLSGMNSGELIDDNKQDEYAKFLKREERKSKERALRLDIIENPNKYIDRFTARDDYEKDFERLGEESFKALYYQNGKPDLYSYYVFNNPEDKIEFNEKYFRDPLRDQWHDERKTFCLGGYWPIAYGIIPLIFDRPIESDEDKEEYEKKLDDYLLGIQEDLTDLQREAIDILSERGVNPELKWEKALSEILQREEIKKNILRQETEEEKEFENKRIFNSDVYRQHWDIGVDQRIPQLKPDDLLSELGWMSPEGDWYSVEFACHGTCAEILVGQFKIPYGDKYMHDYEEVLFDRGWIAVKNIMQTVPRIYWGKYSGEDDLPQAMLNRLWDWRIKFKHYDNK